jgi:prepilin-type processing-associated H-X9-DG protein
MKSHQSNGQNRSDAFTITELILALVCLLIIATIILPLGRSRKPRTINCANNLKQIALSYLTWGLDHNDKYPMEVSVTNGGAMELVNTGTVFAVFTVMSNELSTPKILLCPQEKDSKRVMATTFQSTRPQQHRTFVPFTGDHNVSYLVGVDANQTNAQMILSGDRNLAVTGAPVTHGLLKVAPNAALTWFKSPHGNVGNIVFADGSVRQLSSAAMVNLFKSPSVAANRLAIP